MDTISLSDFDRRLIADLTASSNRLAAALEAQNGSETAEKVYSCMEAAKLLGRTPQTISRYVRQGRIKKGERGGVVGIPESELQKIKTQ